MRGVFRRLGRRGRMQSHTRRSAVARRAARERNHLIPTLVLAFGLGVWIAPHVSQGLWPLWLLPAAVLLGVALHWMGKRLRWVCLPIALMIALLWTQTRLNPPMPQEGSYEVITATVFGDPAERTDDRIALILCNITLDGVPQAGKAYCTMDSGSGMSLAQFFDGASLRFQGYVYHPSGKQNEFDFDFRLWLLQNNTSFGVSGVKEMQVLNTADTAPWTDYAARIRGFCKGQFSRLMGDEGSLAMAMLLGDRDSLAENDQLAFQRAGVAHLMSVSGLHVALLAGALAWLLNAFYIRKSIRLPIMAVLIVLYCALTGFSAAAMRATAMILLLLIAQAVGRKSDPITTLSAAAILVLAINPLQLFSAGFVLSFMAVAAITLLYPRFLQAFERIRPEHHHPKRKWVHARQWMQKHVGKPRELLAVSLAAQVGVLLPTAEYFHLLPLYGIFFNLLAVPLAGLLVPLYAIVLLISLLPWIGGALAMLPGLVAQWGSKALLWLIGLSANLPFAQIRVPSPNVWAYAALILCSVIVSRYVRASVRRRVLTMGIVVIIACAGAYATRPASLRYHQFAVGQGDAALIIDGDKTIAIDVGPYGAEMGERLLAEGRDLDTLILTHLHSDHAMGLQELLSDGIRIRQIYLPDGVNDIAHSEETDTILAILKASGAPVDYLAAGDTLTYPDVTIHVLWPEADRTRAGLDANERSMATLIQLGNLRILSMADNSDLYEQYIAVPCDVLKVAHHGSRDSTSNSFLQIASPSLSMVTCRANALLPSQETLSRLVAHHVRVFRTDQTGEIIIEAVNGGYRTRTYLSEVDDEP